MIGFVHNYQISWAESIPPTWCCDFETYHKGFPILSAWSREDYRKIMIHTDPLYPHVAMRDHLDAEIPGGIETLLSQDWIPEGILFWVINHLDMFRRPCAPNL
jgi:hypothetical protein